MDSHVPLLWTEDHNLLHKSCRKLTRPSAFPLNYPHLSTLSHYITIVDWMEKSPCMLEALSQSGMRAISP